MKKAAIIILLVLIAGCTITSQITSFEECVAAGNPVMESYPRQCSSNGETFTEELEMCGAMSVDQALITAQSSDCALEGILTNTYVCNQGTNTFWVDLTIEDLPGCSPACVVNTNTGEVETNYRCTGLIVDEEQEEVIINETVVEELPSNVVLYYSFDEGQASGVQNTAVSFEGNYVDLSSNISQMSELTEGSISLWFKFESTLDSQMIMPIFYMGNSDTSQEDNMFIIEIGHFDTSSYSSMQLDPDNTKLYVTWIRNNQDPFLCFDTNVNLEEYTWYHLVVVVDETGNTGYLNGNELTNRNYNFGSSSDSSFMSAISSPDQLTIGYGKSHYSFTPDHLLFTGIVDELRIYNEAINQTTVTELYNLS